MVEDERCCGTGTCLINAEGLCWCGQQWDGQVMCRPGSADPALAPTAPADSADTAPPTD